MANLNSTNETINNVLKLGFGQNKLRVVSQHFKATLHASLVRKTL